MGPNLRIPHTVVVVSIDSALSRSLAFALGVHGYKVETFETWQSARPLAMDALCVIMDADVCREDPEAQGALLDPSERIILLSDGLSPSIAHIAARVLTKPLVGADVLAIVELFRSSAK